METCDSTSEMRQRLNLTIEREHMTLWRKINRNLFKVYNDITIIETELKKAGLYQKDNNKATRRGGSSGIWAGLRENRHQFTR